MKAAHEGKPRLDFARPPGIANVTIDAKTGKLPYPDDADTLDEVFLAGTEPTETAPRAAMAPVDVAVDAGESSEAR